MQQPATEGEEALPLPKLREAAQPLAEGLPERLLAAPVLRDGVPLAFVPYLPAEEDLDWPENRERESDEEPEGGDGEEGADTPADDEPAEDEPESADMAPRREKTADMVGALEPGLVFYQKLGDYWT